MEEGSYFLLPSLYRRLSELGIDDAELARLKGVYKRTWYRNQLLLDELQRPLAELRERGVPLLAFGPLALATGWYGELGIRWIPYAEVMTQKDQVGSVEAALTRMGFRRAGASRRHALEPTPYANDGGQVLVVAGAPPLDLLVPGELERAEAELWQRAVDGSVGEESLGRLDPTDEFLLACLAGAKPSGRATPVWVVDALTLLPHVDWPQLLRHAEESRTTLLLKDAVFYLADTFAAPVPAATVAALEDAQSSRRDALARSLVARTDGVAGGFPETVADYLRMSGERGSFRLIAGLPAALKRTWALEHTWQVPGRALSKTVAGARRAV
jgi:hypothetical protein